MGMGALTPVAAHTTHNDDLTLLFVLVLQVWEAVRPKAVHGDSHAQHLAK